MYKVLIVDDEPLVQVGIKSMLNWAELNMEICGTAINGQAALALVEKHSPDLVITDIKMPVMDGLELIRLCRERYGNFRPHFLILTSYEDFHTVKEALAYQVSDYLVKLDLTPESLRDAVCKVLARIQESESISGASESSVRPFFDKFFISLLHNLFESEEQFLLQSQDLNLNFHYAGYVCCYGEIAGKQAESLPMERQLSLFSSSLQMIKELAAKYLPCYCLTLDTRHFALIFCYKQLSAEACPPGQVKSILQNISETLQNYYNVTIRCGIGNLVETAQAISDSYQCSRQAFLSMEEGTEIASFEDSIQEDRLHASFNMSLFKGDLTKAFEEYDTETLKKTIDAICELFSSYPSHYVQALDAACNILYLSLSLLQDGENIVSGFFKDNPEGYRSIYKQTTVEQVANWLNLFCYNLCELFESRRKDYKNYIVTNVKKYVGSHIRERLSLNEVAALFGISPGYLSQLFGKYSDTGFNEYVNICKINESKKLLEEGNLKVYKVAEMLGFESAFYFSKVFKKVEGVSPTEYLNGRIGALR